MRLLVNKRPFEDEVVLSLMGAFLFYNRKRFHMAQGAVSIPS